MRCVHEHMHARVCSRMCPFARVRACMYASGDWWSLCECAVACVDAGRATPKNCTVALKMDVPAFWDIMLDAIAAADAGSPLNTL